MWRGTIERWPPAVSQKPQSNYHPWPRKDEQGPPTSSSGSLQNLCNRQNKEDNVRRNHSERYQIIAQHSV
jgi:hypothetical protein